LAQRARRRTSASAVSAPAQKAGTGSSAGCAAAAAAGAARGSVARAAASAGGDHGTSAGSWRGAWGFKHRLCPPVFAHPHRQLCVPSHSSVDMPDLVQPPARTAGALASGIGAPGSCRTQGVLTTTAQQYRSQTPDAGHRKLRDRGAPRDTQPQGSAGRGAAPAARPARARRPSRRGRAAHARSGRARRHGPARTQRACPCAASRRRSRARLLQ